MRRKYVFQNWQFEQPVNEHYILINRKDDFLNRKSLECFAVDLRRYLL